MSKAECYVLYGFKKAEPASVGYFGKELGIVDEIDIAMKFPVKPKEGQIGFGTPEQWLEFINDDKDLNKGYKFHLVSCK